MAPTTEDIPSPGTASNPPGDPAARRIVASLVEACTTAASGAQGAALVERLLGLALEACSAERAFVIRTARADGDPDPVVEASRMAAAARHSRPSRTVARSLLERREPFVSFDPRRERELVRGGSVRALELSFILGVPLGLAGSPGRALLLDSRRPAASASAVELLEAARGFAALIELGSPVAVDSAEARGPVRLVARSAAMAAALGWIERLARTDLPVLIRGESGCGKEVVARTIHELSARSRGPFVAVSCTELPETLIEAELFGSERGAFTGAVCDRPGLFRSAQGGTLLLDEIGDMPLPLQAKLLRALQQRTVRPLGSAAEVPVDVRIVTATHRDLARGAREGTFREDLYYRLTVTEIAVPPLRDRGDDLELLVDDLGRRLAVETGAGSFEISREALALLYGHDWPGNVRELQSVLVRALLRSEGRPILPDHLLELRCAPERSHPAAGREMQMLRAALAESGGSVTLAARRIGWSRQKLYRRMSALSLRGR